MTHLLAFLHPHDNRLPVIEVYTNRQGTFHGCVALPQLATSAWDRHNRIFIPDKYVKPVGNRDPNDYVGARHENSAQIATHTKKLNDESAINCGILYGHAWNDYRCATWSTRTRSEREINRALAELMVNIPSSMASTRIINVDDLLLCNRVLAPFRFLPHGRGHGGRSHLHAQYNENTRNATNISASHGVLVDYHTSEAAH